MSPENIALFFNYLQSTIFSENLTELLQQCTAISFNLLYFFIAFEVVLFGLGWMFKPQSMWEGLLLRLLKIGLIIIIIQNYGGLINLILDAIKYILLKIGDTVGTDFYFNPAKFLQFNLINSLECFKTLLINKNIGNNLLNLFFGIGLTVTFGVMFLRWLLAWCSFYGLLFLALFTLPLGAFRPTTLFFDQSILIIIRSALKLVIIILLITLISIIEPLLFTPLKFEQNGQLNTVDLTNIFLLLCFSGITAGLITYFPEQLVKWLEHLKFSAIFNNNIDNINSVNNINNINNQSPEVIYNYNHPPASALQSQALSANQFNQHSELSPSAHNPNIIKISEQDNNHATIPAFLEVLLNHSQHQLKKEQVINYAKVFNKFNIKNNLKNKK